MRKNNIIIIVVLTLLLTTVGFGCSKSESARSNSQKSAASGAPLPSKKGADPVTVLKKAVEKVFGAAQLNGLLPNFPLKGTTSVGFISSRSATNGDVDE